MEPITTGVVILLGKYALDKGAELAKEVGPVALDKVKEMFGIVLDKIKTQKESLAQDYQEDPETYEKPMAKELKKAAEEDAAFAEALKKLWNDYEAEAEKYAKTHGATYTATAGDHSTIMQGTRNTVATGGGIVISGNVEGGIHTGGK